MIGSSWWRARRRGLLQTTMAALVGLSIPAAAIVVFSPPTGDVNVPGLTANWPAGTYFKVAPLTGFSYTFQTPWTKMIFRPAGTLLAGYVTMAATPPDGIEACVFSTQIITNLYISANTGQSINDAVTTIAANGRVCYTYSLANATWDRSQ